MTTKILALTDALGNLCDFILLPGQRNDICGVLSLIKVVTRRGVMTVGNTNGGI